MRRGKKRKGVEAQRVRSPTSIRAIDALIGDEEQNGKESKEKKKETATLDLSFASYDPQGSHVEPILLTAPPAFQDLQNEYTR